MEAQHEWLSLGAEGLLWLLFEGSNSHNQSQLGQLNCFMSFHKAHKDKTKGQSMIGSSSKMSHQKSSDNLLVKIVATRAYNFLHQCCMLFNYNI